MGLRSEEAGLEPCAPSAVMKTSMSIDASDQKKTRMKLKKFLLRRPTYQAVRDKGYIQGSVARRRRAGRPAAFLQAGPQLQLRFSSCFQTRCLAAA